MGKIHDSHYLFKDKKYIDIIFVKTIRDFDVYRGVFGYCNVVMWLEETLIISLRLRTDMATICQINK